MDLILCRSLLAVSEHGSIGDAAQALHLSQPALTRRLQRLEAELGTELLVRSGRGVVLSAMGQLAVRESRALIERFERLKEDVRQHLALEAGLVRIGGGATAVSYLLPSAIAAFQKDFEGVRFVVREAGSGEIERAVVEDELELGVVTLPVASGDLTVRALTRDAIVLIAGSQHPLARKGRISPDSLEGQNVVGFEAGSAIRRLIDDKLRAAGVHVNVLMELRSIPAIRQMVETTGSLGFISQLGVGDAPVVGIRGLSIKRRLGLISRRKRLLSPAALAFAQRLTRARAGCAPSEA